MRRVHYGWIVAAVGFVPLITSAGFRSIAAASLLATIGVFDIVGTTASGWLTDRYDPGMLLFWYYGLRGLSLLALPYVFGSPHTSGLLCQRPRSRSPSPRRPSPPPAARRVASARPPQP